MKLKPRLTALLARASERIRTARATGQPAHAHLALGARGERLAADLLERAGYRLVASNFKLPVGRNLRGALIQAEIDLIAYEQRKLCFIEVKTQIGRAS